MTASPHDPVALSLWRVWHSAAHGVFLSCGVSHGAPGGMQAVVAAVARRACVPLVGSLAMAWAPRPHRCCRGRGWLPRSPQHGRALDHMKGALQYWRRGLTWRPVRAWWVLTGMPSLDLQGQVHHIGYADSDGGHTFELFAGVDSLVRAMTNASVARRAAGVPLRVPLACPSTCVALRANCAATVSIAGG